MKKVLIVTDHCPPRTGSGISRIRGLVEYLPEFDWKPTILTREVDGVPQIDCAVIESTYRGDVGDVLKRKFPESFLSMIGESDKSNGESDKSKHISEEELSNHSNFILEWMKDSVYDIVAFPDNLKYWIPDGINEGLQAVNRSEYDVIISSSYPVSAHIVAKEISKKSNLPWVADYRDLWTQSHYKNPNIIRDHYETKLEKRTISQACAVTAATEPFAHKLHQYHDLPTYGIYNGFRSSQWPDDPNLTDSFRLTYTGKIIGRNRNPEIVFEVLGNLAKEYDEFRQDLEFSYYGSKSQELKRMADDVGIAQNLVQHGKVDRNEAREAQAQSQVLLSIQWDHPRDKEVCPGKIFDYLGARRPIVSVGGPRGVTSRILADTNAGSHAVSKQQLLEIFESKYLKYRSEGRVSYYGIEDRISEYNHYRMVQEFNQVLERVVKSSTTHL